MFILKNERGALSLKRSDLLKVRAIQNQWLLPLGQTKHQSHSSGPKLFSQPTRSQNQGHTKWTSCPQGGACPTLPRPRCLHDQVKGPPWERGSSEEGNRKLPVSQS